MLPFVLLAFGIALVTVVHLLLLPLAFEALGLSLHSAIALLACCALGSLVDVPLCRTGGAAAGDGRGTWLAVNLGGALLPCAFTAWLWMRGSFAPGDALVCSAVVALPSLLLSRPEPGVGLTMPMLVAPGVAALTALALDPLHAAAIAYAGGTLGVLVGADVLRLHQTVRLGTPAVTIGGAGTADGIFLTGVVAVLMT